jgi:hypothetical protein
VWDYLDSIMGTIDGPTDWSEEHDHYIYGTPKRSERVINSPSATMQPSYAVVEDAGTVEVPDAAEHH